MSTRGHGRSQALEGPPSRSKARLGPVTKALHSGTSCASLASWQSAVLSETHSEKGAPETTVATHERQLPRRHSLVGMRPAASAACGWG